MKKLIFFALFLTMTVWSNFAHAQRVGYIDLDSILSRLPEYVQIEKETEQLGKNWEAEIAKKRKELIEFKNRYEAEKLILPEKLQKEKEAEIAKREKSLLEQQTKLFGYDGDLVRKRQEMIRPIQEKVYKAAQIVAKKHKLNIILDRSSDMHLVYVDPTYDFTEYVLEELGITDRELVIER